MEAGKIAGMSPQEIAAMAQMFMSEKDEIKELIETFRPVVGEVLELALDTVGPEVERVLLRVALGTVAIRKAVFDEYIKLEFTRDEAMKLMLNDAANTKAMTDGANGVIKSQTK